MPPIRRSSDPIFVCGVCADDTVARRKATRLRAELDAIEARLDLNLVPFSFDLPTRQDRQRKCEGEYLSLDYYVKV